MKARETFGDEDDQQKTQGAREREMKERETVGDEVKRVSWMKARDGWR